MHRECRQVLWTVQGHPGARVELPQVLLGPRVWFIPSAMPCMVFSGAFIILFQRVVLCGSRAPSASTKAWRIPVSRTAGIWESSKGFHPTTPSKSWSGCTLLRWGILVYSEGLSESPRAATTKYYRLGDINSIHFLQFWRLEVHDQVLPELVFGEVCLSGL